MITVTQIKEEISIIEVLERYTNFKAKNPNRRSISAKCPFHSDQKASFAVYPKTNTFKCFSGCNNGKAGDVINVVMLANNIEFKEAVQLVIEDFKLKEEQYLHLQKQKKVKNKIFLKAIKSRIIEQLNYLNAILNLIEQKIITIKNEEDLDNFGDLYHFKEQIKYWIYCLQEDDLCPYTLVEVKRFIERVSANERFNKC